MCTKSLIRSFFVDAVLLSRSEPVGGLFSTKNGAGERILAYMPAISITIPRQPPLPPGLSNSPGHRANRFDTGKSMWVVCLAAVKTILNYKLIWMCAAPKWKLLNLVQFRFVSLGHPFERALSLGERCVCVWRIRFRRFINNTSVCDNGINSIQYNCITMRAHLFLARN